MGVSFVDAGRTYGQPLVGACSLDLGVVGLLGGCGFAAA